MIAKPAMPAVPRLLAIMGSDVCQVKTITKNETKKSLNSFRNSDKKNLTVPRGTSSVYTYYNKVVYNYTKIL